MLLSNLYYCMDAKYGDRSYYHIGPTLTKALLNNKQTLNIPWYTENIACRAELRRYPLSIDIKASIFSYWLRLQHKTVNPLLKEAFQHARNHSQFFDVLTIKNARSSIKKQLKKDYIRNWLKAGNNTSECSREKFTHKEVKFDYQLEDYLSTIRNPAHRISMTKLLLGVHSLQIQTGKYENRGAPIQINVFQINETFIHNCPPCLLAEMAKVASSVARPRKCYINRLERFI